ncbi:complexin-3-like [Anneissia japonica]|uniref:complexin-3-like n=1 Tax=Anneissia japonica TaxID=1529436 RepID=UPI001425913D|nr:complexin-3-like [Anneissia japonica]XP_033100918.1 complexin-3-like [Anneissia japonica]
MSAMLGKALVSDKISKISKGLGIDDEKEEEENHLSSADLKKMKQEDLKKEEEKKKREEMQAKRRAERSARRDEIRDKYGLEKKESDTKKTNTMEKKPATKTQIEDKKDDDKCCVM